MSKVSKCTQAQVPLVYQPFTALELISSCPSPGGMLFFRYRSITTTEAYRRFARPRTETHTSILKVSLSATSILTTSAASYQVCPGRRLIKLSFMCLCCPHFLFGLQPYLLSTSAHLSRSFTILRYFLDLQLYRHGSRTC